MSKMPKAFESLAPEFEIELQVMEGMNWENDDLFFTHEFEDETSQFDPKGTWNYGGEYYSRIYKCRVPIAFQHCELMIDNFVEMMMDNYPDTKGFWVD
jgi:hypothetical protein